MNMNFKRKLPIPMEIKEQFPLSEQLIAHKMERDEEIKKVFTGESNKLVLIIGPCSADNEDAVMDYVTRLAKVQEHRRKRKRKNGLGLVQMGNGWRRRSENTSNTEAGESAEAVD